MNILRRQKCSIQSRQALISYYESLSIEELKKRKTSQLNLYLVTTIAWVFSFVTILIATEMSPPLIVLYMGVIISLLITTWMDYRQRVSLIDKILKAK